MCKQFRNVDEKIRLLKSRQIARNDVNCVAVAEDDVNCIAVAEDDVNCVAVAEAV